MPVQTYAGCSAAALGFGFEWLACSRNLALHPTCVWIALQNIYRMKVRYDYEDPTNASITYLD